MSIPSGAFRAVIGGSLASGERFAYGFWADGNANGGVANFQAWTGGVIGSLTGNFLTTAVKARYPTSTIWDRVDTYRYDGGNDAVEVGGGPMTGVPGTGAGAPMPDQLAIVASLRTGRPGRSYRGRAFLPCLMVGAIGTGGMISTSDMTLLCNAFASFLTATAAGANGKPPVVMSRTLTAMTEITEVQVDSRFDVQRRRAESESGVTRVVAAV